MDKIFGCTVLDEIKATEEAIKSCYSKVEELEEKIQRNEISDEYKKIANQELAEVKKLLATNKKQLSQMHSRSGKSFAIAAAIIFLGFLIYGVYAMYYMKLDNMFGESNYQGLDEKTYEELK